MVLANQNDHMISHSLKAQRLDSSYLMNYGVGAGTREVGPCSIHTIFVGLRIRFPPKKK